MFIVGELSWFRVADWFVHDCCQSHRRYGYCCHPQRRSKINPCDNNQACADACKDIAMGETPKVSIVDILKRASYFRCQRHNCNHAACIETDKVVDWLRQASISKAA